MATPEERFWVKVNKTETCWLWAASLDRRGYGRFRVNRKLATAHRFAYESMRGPVAPGLDLDHLCRVPACVNPAHLEPVSHRENVLRSPISMGRINADKTHCPQGHEYTPENTRYVPLSRSPRHLYRACIECTRERGRRYSRSRRTPTN